MEKKTVPAKIEYMGEVLAFIDRFLDAENCSENQRYCIDVSVEELFTNIASYAYKNGDGIAEIFCELESSGGGALGEETKELVIELRDRGIPYDPWSRKDPDFQVPFEERPIGGLGIYMTKRFMDHVEYRHEDGCNITVLRKRIGGDGDGRNL